VSPEGGFLHSDSDRHKGDAGTHSKIRWERASQILYAEVPASVLRKEAELLARGDLGGGLPPNG
jgi:hypothetical protein